MSSIPGEAEINAAIERLAKKGLIIDSGRKRWSDRKGRLEIVSVAAKYVKMTPH